MTEEEMTKYADSLYEDLRNKEFGGFFILVNKEGILSLTALPTWTILAVSKKEQKIILDKVRDNETVEQWLERAEKTTFFLEAMSQALATAKTNFSQAQQGLEEFFNEIVKEVEAKKLETPTLH